MGDARELAGQTDPPALETTMQRLRTAVDHSRLLLEFAIANNKPVEESTISGLMNAINVLGDLQGDNPLGAEKEQEFWKAYQALAKNVAPVTAQSIIASRTVTRSFSATTTVHAVITALTFLLLAVLLVAWVTGTTLRKELDDVSKQIATKDARLREITVLERGLESTLKALEPKPVGKSDGTKPLAPLSPQDKARAEEIKQQLQKINTEQGPLLAEIQALKTSREPLVDLIEGWYDRITLERWPISGKMKIFDLEQKKKDREKQVSPDAKSFSKFLFLFTLDPDALNITRAKDAFVVELKHRVDLVLDTLRNYVIPVLLGLLGALTYILRSLIASIRDCSYTAYFSSLSIIRICLGMMAGLLGGVLIPSADDVFKGLPPLALPFILGYAIEVLFAFMDRIVTAFTTREKT